MALQTIVATKVIDGVEKSAQFNFDFGDNVQQAIEKFGADVVFSNFKRSAVITAQAAMRRGLEAKKSEADIAAAMNNWKPGVALERTVDAVKSLIDSFATKTKEEQEAILADLMAKMQAAQ